MPAADAGESDPGSEGAEDDIELEDRGERHEAGEEQPHGPQQGAQRPRGQRVVITTDADALQRPPSPSRCSPGITRWVS